MNLPLMKVGRAILALTLLRSVRNTERTVTSEGVSNVIDCWNISQFSQHTLEDIQKNRLKVRMVNLNDSKNAFTNQTDLQKLKSLEVKELRLNNSNIGLDTFKNILVFAPPTLEILCLDWNFELRNKMKNVHDDLSFLEQNGTNLKKLSLVDFSPYKSSEEFFIGVLKYLPNLKILCFSKNDLSGLKAGGLASINKDQVKLEVLDLQDTDLVLESFREVVTSLPNLKFLDISGNILLEGRIEDFAFLEEIWNIEEIYVDDCTGLSDGVKKYIQGICSRNKAKKQAQSSAN